MKGLLPVVPRKGGIVVRVIYELKVTCEGKIYDLYMEGMLLNIPRKDIWRLRKLDLRRSYHD